MPVRIPRHTRQPCLTPDTTSAPSPLSEGKGASCLRRSHTLHSMGAWTARGSWSIETIVLDTTPCYRVLRHGYLISYCASLEELAELLEMNGLDLGDLVEDDEELAVRFKNACVSRC